MTTTDSDTQRFEAGLRALPAVAILRASSSRHLLAAAEVLIAAGFRTLEFPLTTPDATDVITAARRAFGDTAVIGAGTVLDAAAADRALDAGAQLLVSPGLCLEVLAAGLAVGVPVLPGTFTTSEVLTAHAAGATIVKLFPVNVVGPDYLTALRQPLPTLRAIPTGGVSLANARGWLAAGAAALGLGSPLLAQTLETGDLDQLRDLARTWVDTIRGRP